MLDKPHADYARIETLMRQGLLFDAMRKSLSLGLFDMLQGQGRSAGEVAGALSLQPEQVCSLLDMFTVSGFLLREGGRYCNAPVAADFLVSSSPFFQGKSLELHQRFNDYVVENMETLLKGGQAHHAHFDDTWGRTDAMEGTAQYARLGSLQDAGEFIAALPGFGDMRLMGDIGGNHGEFCMAALDSNPALSAEILDLPGVAENVGPRIAERGYEGRLRAVCCDLREDRLESARYDLLLASHVLYGFVDKLDALTAMVHQALRPGGWFVSHHLSPENALPSENVAALEFLTRLSGYTSHFLDPAQLSSALEAAGFEDCRTKSCGMHDDGLLLAARKAA